MMKKKTVTSIVSFMLSILCATCSFAELDQSKIQAASKYLLAESSKLALYDEQNITIRCVYEFTVPKDGEITVAINDAYGGYSSIVLIEYGIELIKPIKSSVFACVGIQSDGSFDLCQTPIELAAQLGMLDILDGVDVVIITLP